MKGTLVVKTAPAVEPLTVAEAKDHLRIDHNDEDVLLNSLIMAARQHVESPLTNRSLITTTWNYYLPSFGFGSEIELPRPPLQSVTGIYYTTDGGSETEFDSSKYSVDTYSTPGRIVLNRTESWPTDELEEVNGVRIEFVAGYGDDDVDVPQAIRQAMLLIVAEMYENREDVVVGAGNSVVTVPYSSTVLLQDYRKWSFGQ